MLLLGGKIGQMTMNRVILGLGLRVGFMTVFANHTERKMQKIKLESGVRPEKCNDTAAV